MRFLVAILIGCVATCGNPLGNRDMMMAKGYQRGFGFLPGVAVDQHFTQRRHFDDLERVVDRHPQLLGIGIDVHFFDRRADSAEPNSYLTVAAGGRFDLSKRRGVE